MLKNKPLIATAFIAVVLIVAAPTFLMNSASAATIVGSTEPQGIVTCPNGSTVSGVALIFDVFNIIVKSAGSFTLSTHTGSLLGEITRFQTASNKFFVDGTVTHDGICPSNNTPSRFLADFTCGSNVIVGYRSLTFPQEFAKIPGVDVRCQG
jgi:hypothetical protein